MNTAPLRFNQLAVASTTASKEPFLQSTVEWGRIPHSPPLPPSSSGQHHRGNCDGKKNDLSSQSRGHSLPKYTKEYHSHDKDCSFLSGNGSSNRRSPPPSLPVKEDSSEPSSQQAETMNKNKKKQGHFPLMKGLSWLHPFSRYTSSRQDAEKNRALRTNHHHHHHHHHPLGRDETHPRFSHAITTTKDRDTKNPSHHVLTSAPSGRLIDEGIHHGAHGLSGQPDRPTASPPPRHADTSGASTQRPTVMRMPSIGRPVSATRKPKGVPTWIVFNTACTAAAVSRMSDVSQDDDDGSDDSIDLSLPCLFYAVGKYAGPNFKIDDDDASYSDLTGSEDDSYSDLTESSTATLESYNIGSDYTPLTVGGDEWF